MGDSTSGIFSIQTFIIDLNVCIIKIFFYLFQDSIDIKMKNMTKQFNDRDEKRTMLEKEYKVIQRLVNKQSSQLKQIIKIKQCLNAIDLIVIIKTLKIFKLFYVLIMDNK